MNQPEGISTPMAVEPMGAVLTTPTGTQSMGELGRRRAIVIVLNLVTYVVMMSLAAAILATGGISVVDALLLIAFAIGLPWTVLGFWNSVIGLWLLHGTRDAMAEVAPFAAAGDVASPLTIRTAVVMTLRNEDPARAFERLRTVKASLDATGEGPQFDYFILSDTNRPEVARAEEAAMAAWQRELGPREATRVIYRRRPVNTGFKAGNLRDFCARWGRDYELMLPLDADSLMAGEAIVRLARMMQAHPRLGILQSLVVGMPSMSAFARIFQFGMRHGMRAYTMGQAWWVGDCGPFWGHNAMVRIKPFSEACELPVLPGGPPLGGHVLSHDQVEATLMRRAGYEVRVLPEERGSWEENPPTMLEFARRDIRWCQGNLQYLKLLDMPGLKPMSRFQLAWAILMFLGLPAWTLMVALTPIAAWQAKAVPEFPAAAAALLYVVFLLMYLSPKIAGLTDAALTPGGVSRYGGTGRFLASAVIEVVFSFLQGAVSTIRTTIFMIGLAFGASVAWGGQARDAHGISWVAAVRELWPQTLFGIVVCGGMFAVEPAVLWWSLPLTAGYLLAIPFAVLTAAPAFGRALKEWGLCGIPEDFDPPAEIRAMGKAPG
ncbi:MAG TPA: glucans biosynthesis glucosyltransferase MdoH [Hyphomicrobiaceae bacterium]|nr:glucans biosynthesis glucosyltransferase MdoH [Hyphomicrobiaceae bacterium]